MILPLYVALEKIDGAPARGGQRPLRQQLAARSAACTLPLALPGVFAGTLLTFIPAMGDYVNAELLGNPQTQMIGNVIQNAAHHPGRLPARVGPLVHPDGGHPDRRVRLRPRCSAPSS